MSVKSSLFPSITLPGTGFVRSTVTVNEMKSTSINQLILIKKVLLSECDLSLHYRLLYCTNTLEINTIVVILYHLYILMTIKSL